MHGTKVCERCKKAIDDAEMIQHGKMLVCENCAMDLMSPAKACDPWAVKLASGSFRTTTEAVGSLQGLEKKLYGLVSDRVRVPFETLPKLLEVPENQVSRALATLRHMELVKGERRVDGGADCVLFNY